MLKLTNSFYRYISVICERDYRVHVVKFSQFHVSEKCGGGEHKRQFHCGQVLRKSSKKRIQVKIPPFNSDEFEKTEQMSESVQPTHNHVSIGGQFTESSDEETSQGDYRKSNDPHKTQPSEIPPDFRIWESVVKRSTSNNGAISYKFSVVSYNVLAQYLLECHPYLYTDCAPRDLKWTVRSARLYDEIIALAPDILCLQEVQVSHLSSFYSKFEDIGYNGIFKQKTGHRQDGCAIYYKESLFEMKDHIHVEFYQPDLPLLNRDNIGIMVKLVPRCAPNSPIVVATTHLLYNPKRTDVRLAQIQVFLAEIDRFAYFNNGRECGHLPIILTGDFNSTPESAVIKLLDRGHVSARSFRDESDWQRIGVTDNCQHLSVYLNRQEGRHTDFSNVKIFNSTYSLPEVDAESSKSKDQSSFQLNSEQLAAQQFSGFFNTGHIYHSLQLESVYDKYRPDGSYEASTFQDYWVTVDYIYFSCCSYLSLTDRLRLPSAEECCALGRLPNSVYASDHLALAAVFEITSPIGRSAL